MRKKLPLIQPLNHRIQKNNTYPGELYMFGQLGEIAGLMKKMSSMQSNMKKMKKELENLEVVGRSTNGAVQITMTADMGKIKGVQVSQALSAPEMEIAIGEAMMNVLNNAKAESAKRISEATGGIDLSALGMQ